VSVGKPILITVNGEARSHDGGAIDQLLRALGHDPEQPGIAVAINEEVVPRRAWGERLVMAGDRVEIVAAVQGG
jgi:sulfur carrier protein